MDRDLLTPQLGRLIDEAKTAASRAVARPAAGSPPAAGPAGERAEGVALLLEDETMCVAPGPEDDVHGAPAAAAVAAARRAGGVEILVAAVAVANDPAQTLLPCPRTRRDLAQVDPELPLVLKQKGRWVRTALHELKPLAEEMTVTRLREPGHELLLTLQTYDLEAFGAAALRSYDLAVVSEAGAVFLAYLSGEIVGGCQLLRVLDEPRFFYVVGFYIRPEWQRLGLGRGFLEAIVREAGTLGAEGLVLTVSPDNERALKLYENAGFVNERFAPHFYGEGQDRYILRLRFAQGGLQGSV